VERGISVNKLAATAVLLMMLTAMSPAFAEEQLVLIVSSDSKVEQLDSLEVRKLFLGLTVTHEGNRLRPILNEADARVKEVFLQNIVALSDITYDRRLLQLALQQGRTQPTVYKHTTELLRAIAADPSAVSYAWSKDVARDPHIKILRILWHD
jgi:hypothetical protein